MTESEKTNQIQIDNSKNTINNKNFQKADEKKIKNKVFPKIPENQKIRTFSNTDKAVIGIDRKTLFLQMKEKPEGTPRLLRDNKDLIQKKNKDKIPGKNCLNDDLNEFLTGFFKSDGKKTKIENIKEDIKYFRKREWENPIHDTVRKQFKEKKLINIIVAIGLLGAMIYTMFVGLGDTFGRQRTFHPGFKWTEEVNAHFVEYLRIITPIWLMALMAATGFTLWLVYYFFFSHYNMGDNNKIFILLVVIVLEMAYPIMHIFLILNNPPTDKVLWDAMTTRDSNLMEIVVIENALPRIYLPIIIGLFLDVATVKHIPRKGMIYLYALEICLELTDLKKFPPKPNVPKYFTLLLKKLDALLYETLSVRIANLRSLAERFTQIYLLDYKYTQDLVKSNFDAIFFDLLNMPAKDLKPSLIVIILDRINNILNKTMQDYDAEYRFLIKHKITQFKREVEKEMKMEEPDREKGKPLVLSELTNKYYSDYPELDKNEIKKTIEKSMKARDSTNLFLEKIYKVLKKQREEESEEELSILIEFESYFGRLKRRSIEIFSSLAVIGGVIGAIVQLFL